MIEPKTFYDILAGHSITFFTGVPDSLLKHFCTYLEENTPNGAHTITANEGNAIALAAGHYLGSGNPACVYLQNSGLGNTVNPLVSLTSSAVYRIPMLLCIGWRGEPSHHDEPQHIQQGAITQELLDTLSVPYAILPKEEDEAEAVVMTAVAFMKKEQTPYALLVKKGTFTPYSSSDTKKGGAVLSREEALSIILKQLSPKDVVVTTTGKTSRELFEYRAEQKEGHERDFLTVGSMGHASSIALGIAKEKSDRTVWCLDGDGALLMHMGALAIIGTQGPKNLIHVVLNNGAHESVGGHPTAVRDIDLLTIARGCRYPHIYKAHTASELSSCLREIVKRERKGPVFLEIQIEQGSRENLGRPTTTPEENKKAFMKFLGSQSDKT